MKTKYLLLLAMLSVFSIKFYAQGTYDLAEQSKLMVNWVKKSQKSQSYYDYGEVYTEYRTLWTLKNGVYSFSGSSDVAFNCTDDDEEDYSDPFDVCLHSPDGRISCSISKTTLKISFVEQIQIACSFGRNGNPRKPGDGATLYYGCRAGSHTATDLLELKSGNIKVKYSYTCSHSTYQTPRKNYAKGRTSSGRVVKQVLPGSSADPFAPWRQVHKQTNTYNLDEIARMNGITKKELVLRILETETFKIPFTDGIIRTIGDFGFSLYRNDGRSMNPTNTFCTVLYYCLYTQFGITPQDVLSRN